MADSPTTDALDREDIPDGPVLVVGFDRDPASRTALHTARDLALRCQAWLLVVHVEDLRDRPVDPEGPDWEAAGASMLAEEASAVHAVLHDHPLGWSYEVRHGSPADALAEAAADTAALMVVVGHHGVGLTETLHRLVDRSTGRSLLRAGTSPVLLVPHP